ncbi:UDP-N-acetylmuramate dehydrogenase [Dyadobacter sandarakinus]|uniref:UDP-N-acetylenolpyruvoylglucosamine reductase n=1 Tax=Dyadobacter sandarakinus TaxID=2747268 RepID=A0ABX7IB52_9BACT|nr:UDP-N-acetylmuramate dehydrogenase [Dyadobacter sandarakinus]QRR02682.1 UDP-N-acetylmuramate dehydrogenase [Dyadobacter sandarakinus]
MQVLSHFPLTNLNTFGLEAEARYYARVTSAGELTSLLRDARWKDFPKFVLGGGSNVLLTRDINALVIQPDIRGIEAVKETNETVWLKAGAGEGWHSFVMYCVNHNLAGIENLSLIPGTVGAAPMQNIGAYGVEVKDVIETVEAVSLDSGELRIFSASECRFGYRESIFKHELKDRYIITAATFRLSRKPEFHVEYGDIQKTLETMGVTELSLKAVSEAVMHIRRSKLPDPAVIGNAGSFFKNPEITREDYEKSKALFPDMPGYPLENGNVKVPAGWLIEKAGWKGYREGAIGVHERQALVLVNYGGGRGEDLIALSRKIQSSVKQQFGIQLNAEVNLV